MFKIAVFDLDGTLADSLTDLAICVNLGLAAAGLPEKPVKNFKTYVGNGRAKLIWRAMDGVKDERLFDIVEKTFNEEYALRCTDNTTAYNGCAKLLEGLKSRGIMTAVLSNKPDEFVERILRKLYPSHSFAAAWGKKPEFKPKPDGEALNALLKLCKVYDRSECIYVGDSDVDVFTAQNAGVAMAGVEWGFRGKNELICAGAPFVAASADELFEYICNGGAKQNE
ncbi:MAG: HAD-IA family hydrolase [Ruminococcus sp.]|nr:HAD-IA family hydrolase [Ruminococcus sp.]MEE1171051.1 HAD-IA family hydrolase [Ruminococcus sp.]